MSNLFVKYEISEKHEICLNASFSTFKALLGGPRSTLTVKIMVTFDRQN